MTIDIRAKTYCNLGPLISASINDSYIQEAGLIYTTGSCELDGIVVPPPGSVVTFSYLKDGIARNIPRKLRVLSSFADPFRKTTQIELGCKLTYMADLREPIDWTAYDDPQNEKDQPDEEKIVVKPIHAKSVLDECLAKIGVTASSNPLTNEFSIKSFDFSGGYVDIIGALLVSESYCGYLDMNEVLQIFPLTLGGGTGPVLSRSNIIDISGIGSGGLPAEAVTVAYSTLRLRADESSELDEDEMKKRDWEYDESVGAEVLVTLRYDDGSENAQEKYFTYRPVTTTSTKYATINGQEQVVLQEERSYSIAAAEYGSYFEARFKEGLPVLGETEVIMSQTITSYSYEEPYPGYTRNTVTSVVSQANAKIVGALNVPFVIDGFAISWMDTLLSETERTETITETIGDASRTITNYYKLWPYTVQGQQAVAENYDDFTSIGQVNSYIGSVLGAGLSYAGSDTSRQGVGASPLGRPSPYSLVMSPYLGEAPLSAYVPYSSGLPGADGKGSGYSTPGDSELELALGSPTAQRRTEFSMPYAPDDTFTYAGFGKYIVKTSDAPQKANYYGKIQNKILLGNRNGMNIQSVPEAIPSTPFSPVIINVDGSYVLYRTNGNTWTVDSTGIIAATDALMWGAIGAS